MGLLSTAFFGVKPDTRGQAEFPAKFMHRLFGLCQKYLFHEEDLFLFRKNNNLFPNVQTIPRFSREQPAWSGAGGEFFGEEGGGGGDAGGSELAGRADGYDLAAVLASAGAHVDDVVGGLEDVEVVLDDEYGVAAVDELAEEGEECADVLEVESGGGLIEDEEGSSGILLAEFGGELDALFLSTGEGGGWLSQLDVSEAYLVQHFDFLDDRGDVGNILTEGRCRVDYNSIRP